MQHESGQYKIMVFHKKATNGRREVMNGRTIVHCLRNRIWQFVYKFENSNAANRRIKYEKKGRKIKLI